MFGLNENDFYTIKQDVRFITYAITAYNELQTETVTAPEQTVPKIETVAAPEQTVPKIEKQNKEQVRYRPLTNEEIVEVVNLFNSLVEHDIPIVPYVVEQNDTEDIAITFGEPTSKIDPTTGMQSPFFTAYCTIEQYHSATNDSPALGGVYGNIRSLEEYTEKFMTAIKQKGWDIEIVADDYDLIDMLIARLYKGCYDW